MQRHLFSKEYKGGINMRNIVIGIAILLVISLFVYAYATILHAAVD